MGAGSDPAARVADRDLDAIVRVTLSCDLDRSRTSVGMGMNDDVGHRFADGEGDGARIDDAMLDRVFDDCVASQRHRARLHFEMPDEWNF